jgi:hypothetical protein
MAAPTNIDVLQKFAQIGTPFTVWDNQGAPTAVGAGVQSTAVKALAEVNRYTTSVANGAVILPSISFGEAGGIVIIVNDSPNSITVGGGVGDKVNGVATTTSFGAGVLAVAAATSAVFVSSTCPSGIGGGALASPNNWHAAAFP